MHLQSPAAAGVCLALLLVLPTTSAAGGEPIVTQRIDRLIEAQLRKDGVPPSPRSDNAAPVEQTIRIEKP